MKLDDSDNSAGWKYAEYEMKGVPVRIELGPRDIEAGQCVLALRHSGEKRTVPLENVSAALAQALEDVRSGMYSAALANRASRTYDCATAEEILSTLAEKGDGFVRAHVVRRRGLRGRGEGENRRQLALHPLRRDARAREPLRLLRQGGQASRLLGQGVLRIGNGASADVGAGA